MYRPFGNGGWGGRAGKDNEAAFEAWGPVVIGQDSLRFVEVVGITNAEAEVLGQ